jgi:D-3-phosphoglycerate dehydrogenase
VRYEGDIADEDVEFVTASALEGVFTPLEWQVNAINAPRVAEERGIEVTEEKRRQTEDFQNLVTVTVGDGEDEIGACGTLFAGDDPRIVRLDSYRIDAIPHGHMLVVRNEDTPGVLGHIGTVLGDSGVNIAGMFNGRDTVGGEAMTVYTLDSPVPDDAIEEIRADDRILEVRQITLTG